MYFRKAITTPTTFLLLRLRVTQKVLQMPLFSTFWVCVLRKNLCNSLLFSVPASLRCFRNGVAKKRFRCFCRHVWHVPSLRCLAYINYFNTNHGFLA